mgnify:CR=1 FL=1
MFKLFVRVILLIAFCAMFIGCGAQPGSNSAQLSNTIKASSIVIDNTGIIPLLNNSSTSTLVYVHNMSRHQIDGIKYEIIFESSSDLVKSSFDSGCEEIAANNSCPLNFTIPSLNQNAINGSFLIVAHYIENGQAKQFSQPIDYQVVNNESSLGVKIMSGASLAGYGNKVAYATIYAYGTGSENNYFVDSVSTSLPSINIENGDISNTTMQSGFVQAIEVKSEVPDIDAFSSIVSIKATNESKTYNFTDQTTMIITPNSSNHKLILGSIPAVDTSLGNTTGTALVTNMSDSSVENFIATPSGGFTIISSCSSIPAYGNCIVKFNVPQYHGTGILSVSGYINGQLTSNMQPVVWFNSAEGALLSLSITPQPLITHAFESNENANVNVNNIGGMNMDSLDISDLSVLSGMAKASVTNIDCNNLITNTSCNYKINVSDNIIEDGKILVHVKGYYNVGDTEPQTYDRNVVLEYSSLSNTPNITISTPNAMEIEGNNVESLQQIITLTNNGTVDANINTINLNKASESVNLVKLQDGCAQKVVLANGGQCNIVVSLGPQLNTTESSILTSAFINVSYTGGTLSQAESQNSQSFDAKVKVNGQRISLTAVTSQNNESGNGAINNPFILFGGNPNSKSVTLTYMNTGTSPLRLDTITFNLESTLWGLDTTSSTCQSTTLMPNNSCSIVLNNLFAQNITSFGNVGAVFNMNIDLPKLSYTNMNNPQLKYSSTPTFNGSNIVYVAGHQATLSNQISFGNLNTLTIYHNLANAANYPAGSIKIQSVTGTYFTSSPTSSECNVNVGTNTTELCTFLNVINGQETLSLSYPIKNSNHGANISFDFALSKSNPNIVSALNQTNLKAQIPYYLIINTTTGIFTSLDGINWTNTNINTANQYTASGVVYNNRDNKLYAVLEDNDTLRLDVMSSLDGVSWNVVYSVADAVSPSGYNPAIYFDVSSGNLYFIYGDATSYAYGRMVVSTDNGVTWNPDPTIISDNQFSFMSLAFGGGKMAAATLSDSALYPNYSGLTKNNGNWATNPFFPISTTTPIGNITYYNGKFYAISSVGNLYSASSSNGWSTNTWESVTPPATRLSYILDGSNKLLFAGRGVIYTSSDGAIWKQESCASGTNIRNGIYASQMQKYFLPSSSNMCISNGNGSWTASKINGVTGIITRMASF